MQAGLHLIKTSPAVSCPSISVSMFRFCWLSQFLLYQDIQTFTISIVSGHSDCWFSQFLLHQNIQTLLTLTISIRTFRLSQFLLYQDIQTLLTFTISIRTFRLCWLSQFLLYQDIQTLLTLTFLKESGFRCFGWRVPYRLQATITSTAVTHRTLGERKYMHTNSIFLKSKHTQTVKHALSKLRSQRWHQQCCEILNTCNASSASLSFQRNHASQGKMLLFFSFFFKSSGPHPCSERKRQDSPLVLLEPEGWPQAANRRGTAWPETVALAVLMPSQKRKKEKKTWPKKRSW